MLHASEVTGGFPVSLVTQFATAATFSGRSHHIKVMPVRIIKETTGGGCVAGTVVCPLCCWCGSRDQISIGA